MRLRRISASLLDEVIQQPQQMTTDHYGHEVRQSKFGSESGKTWLLRVVIDNAQKPPAVVTVIRTDKIADYWR